MAKVDLFDVLRNDALVRKLEVLREANRAGEITDAGHDVRVRKAVAAAIKAVRFEALDDE